MNTHRRYLAVALAAMSLAGGAQAADAPQAFRAGSTTDVLRALGAADAAANTALHLAAPKIAENGMSVAVEVTSRIPGTEWIAIIADKNPTPLAALVHLTDRRPSLQARIKLLEPSMVRVVAKAGGRYYSTEQFVKVVEGGCGGGSPSVTVDSSTHTVGATRVRSRFDDDRMLVQTLIQHPMETGLRQRAGKMVSAIDAKTGKPVVPHYVQRLRAHLNDKQVLDAHWGPSIAATPIFTFGVSDYRKGDHVTIEWEDNQGKRGGNKVTLS